MGNSCRSLAFSFRVARTQPRCSLPKCVWPSVKSSRTRSSHPREPWQTGRPLRTSSQTGGTVTIAAGRSMASNSEARKPSNSGSLFYNYKGFFSLVLLAVVDAEYMFIWVHVGSNGSSSDCGIFNRSELKPGLCLNTWFPSSTTLLW